MFHLMFVYYTFSSVLDAEWPPFGKSLPTRLAICSHCLLSICIFSFNFHGGFESGSWFLIASVPVDCFSISLIFYKQLPDISDGYVCRDHFTVGLQCW